VLLPDGEGPFPVLVQYSGYNHGNNPYDGTFDTVVDDLLAEGIAVAGVNLRGSGCSGGTFRPLTTQWAEDGVEVVEWLADQPWSDGKVAMAVVSYPSITALATAVRRPPSLTAVVASVPVVDLYPDVAWPGGAWNATFSSVWTLVQKYGTLFAAQETLEGDLECPTAVPGQNDPADLTGVQAARHPYIDSLDRYTDFLMPEHLAGIEVPTLVYTAWQDEQLGSRAMHAYEHLHPARRWIVASNGDHIGFSGSDWYRDLATRFLVHFLRDGGPGAVDAPRVQVAREVRRDGSFEELDTYATYPVPTVTTTLHAHPDGSLRWKLPDRSTGTTHSTAAR
jgi:putative CocE/NonD family hydrolase